MNFRTPSIEELDTSMHTVIRRNMQADSVLKNIFGYGMKIGIEWLTIGLFMVCVTFVLKSTAVFFEPPLLESSNVFDLTWGILTSVTGMGATCEMIRYD